MVITNIEFDLENLTSRERESVCECVCERVCVGVRERQSDIETDRQIKRQR